MLEQYRRIKEQHREALVFFRLGDFYEMFYEDAEIGARELEITLTKRPAGKAGLIPMCGVPFHAAEGYINRLVAKGYKVAICEQIDAEAARSKLLERQIVRIVTPGTVLSEGTLKPKENRFIAALFPEEGRWGLAYADISTGESYLGSLSSDLEEELRRVELAEIVVSSPKERGRLSELAGRLGISLSLHQRAGGSLEEIARQRFGLSLEEAVAGCGPGAIKALGLLLSYLFETQKNPLEHLRFPRRHRLPTRMVLDAATRRNLEIFSGRHTGSREGSLLGVIDFTLTPMGGRMLKRWLEEPLLEVAAINARLDSVEELVNARLIAQELRRLLGQIRDLERLVAKCVYATATPRDLLTLKDSLKPLPSLVQLGSQLSRGVLADLVRDFDSLGDLDSLLEAALDPQAPASTDQGGVIRPGYHPEVDRLREARDRGQEWIARLEAQERERTGIRSLKVGYNRVFGYYIEVTKANLSLIPPEYRRRQTLANVERFVTPELQELEETILRAEEELILLEQRLFAELRKTVADNASRVQEATARVAALDCLQSLAEAAVRYHYVRPLVDESDCLEIVQGRHPVVERYLGPGEFVANDAYLDGHKQRLIILTGPNMAGKSTFMRQVALIVLMAQIGSFVPAASARIGLVDRIFTRVGATDDVVFGRSTFMMEMLECKAIVEEATSRSLVIMDEVGRGTSTYDGLSLARALLEFIHQRIRCRTLFSTHYHELTSLEDEFPGVANFTVAVEENGGELLFLRTVSRGRASKSYGIQVAALAGLPAPIISRAKEIIGALEKTAAAKEQAPPAGEERPPVQETSEGGQLQLFAPPRSDGREQAVLNELRRLDLINMTPLEALNKLYSLQSRLKRAR
jgi:DNA mismatch repair protein MutS